MKVVDLNGAIIAMLGVILIYDARPITIKLFSFGDQNEGALGVKIIGAVISLIGSILAYIF